MISESVKLALKGKRLYVYCDGIKQYKGEALQVTNLIEQGNDVSIEGILTMPNGARIEVSELCPFSKLWDLVTWQKVVFTDAKTNKTTVLVLYP